MSSEKKERKLISPRELIVLGIVLVIAVIAIFALRGKKEADPNKVFAVIRFGNEVVAVYPLDEDATITSAGLNLPTFDVEIQVKDGKIAFIKSECPDQVCVHTGWLSLEHDLAACLPANISIILETSVEYDV